MPGDFAAQVNLAFDRLRSALEGVGLGYEHVVRLGAFIVDHDLDKLETLGKPLHARFGDRLPTPTRRRPAQPGEGPVAAQVGGLAICLSIDVGNLRTTGVQRFRIRSARRGSRASISHSGQ
ncbi:hypothetical protein GCM10010433_27180 [Streptomyces pulveraceus]